MDKKKIILKEGRFYRVMYKGFFNVKLIYGFLKSIDLENHKLYFDREGRGNIYISSGHIMDIQEVIDKGDELNRLTRQE